MVSSIRLWVVLEVEGMLELCTKWYVGSHNAIVSSGNYYLKILVRFSLSFPLMSGEFLNLIRCP